MFKSITITALLLLASLPLAQAQRYILPNEKLIFSFETPEGKLMTLTRDRDDLYIVYRFGTAKNVELEYPAKKDISSWQLFKYSYYLRGGGPDNEGLDLNYVQFTNKGYKYVIYNNSAAADNSDDIGIKIINLKTKKTIDIKARKGSENGTLIDCRDFSLIGTSEEQFD